MRNGVALLLPLALLLPACGGGGAYVVTVISRDASGKVSETGARGTAKGKHSAVSLTLGTETTNVVCKGSRSTGATFEITWPERSKEEVTVSAGSSSDHFYMGGDIGLRIRVE